MKSEGAPASYENLPTRAGESTAPSARANAKNTPTSPSTPRTAGAASESSLLQHLLVFLMLAVAVALVLWLLPRWQVESLKLAPKESLILENTLRDTWAKIIATALLLIGAFFLWRYVEAVGKTVAAAERTVAAAEKNAAISQERHITERFVRVMELLGDEKLEVRLGGIYALERIARDSPADQSAVTEVLATYVREHAPWSEGAPLPPRVRADMQAILTVLGRRSWAEREEQPLDLHGSALATAYLPFARLQRAFLYEANLKGAMLYKANLRGAWLWKAHLHNAILEGAHLEGADLTAANGLTWEQLEQANLDKNTKLPDYLRATAPEELPGSDEAAQEVVDESAAFAERESTSESELEQLPSRDFGDLPTKVNS